MTINDEYKAYKIEEAIECKLKNVFVKLINDKKDYKLSIISKNNEVSEKTIDEVTEVLKTLGFNIVKKDKNSFVIDTQSINNFMSLLKLKGKCITI